MASCKLNIFGKGTKGLNMPKDISQIRDGHQLSSMNQRESNAPQSLHCKSRPWDNISRQDRGGVEQTNHSDKGLSLKTPRLKRNNCHGSMDQWFGSHPTGIFSNKKKHQKPWKFQGGSSYWTHQTTEPISSTKGPLALWEFTSRCQAKGACHRRLWSSMSFSAEMAMLFFQRQIRWNGSRFSVFWNVGGSGCSLLCLLIFLDQHGASYYILKLSVKYRYHRINVEFFMFHNILAWKPLMFLHCCTSALCDTSFPPIRISLSCVHYRHNPSHKVPLRLVLSLGLKMDALTILPRFGFISKIHSSSSCTTFTCDARQSNQENYVKPSIFAWHGTLLCGERW